MSTLQYCFYPVYLQLLAVAVEIASSESPAPWTALVLGLKRGLSRPVIVVLDGNQGLSMARRLAGILYAVWRDGTPLDPSELGGRSLQAQM